MCRRRQGHSRGRRAACGLPEGGVCALGVLHESEPDYSGVAAEARTRAPAHTAAHATPCHWAGGGCLEGNGRGHTSSPPHPRLRPWRALPSPPGSRLLGRSGGLGGVGPSRTGGPFGAGEGATRGTGAPAVPGAKAPGLAAGRDLVVNDLITRLGRWSCDQPSQAPPTPRSAPRWGYKTAPLSPVLPAPAACPAGWAPSG